MFIILLISALTYFLLSVVYQYTSCYLLDLIVLIKRFSKDTWITIIFENGLGDRVWIPGRKGAFSLRYHFQTCSRAETTP